jgi:hypothetical protein
MATEVYIEYFRVPYRVPFLHPFFIKKKIFEVLKVKRLLLCSDMRRDVQEIFRNTPHEKQVMMFSATLSKDIRPVCKKFMQDVGVLHPAAAATTAGRPPAATTACCG